MSSFGIDELRRAVRALDGCNENFLQRFTAAELLCIWRAWRAWAAAGDINWPDDWTEAQLAAVLAGNPYELTS